MKTFGIRISVIIVQILLIFTINLRAQNTCPCNQNECGDIIASFKLGTDLTVVCDGYEFLVLNNSTITDVSYFIWDWGDGSRDSVTTTAAQKHIYNITDDQVCKRKQSVFEICLLAVKNCGSDFSCHSNRSPVTVIHRAEAKFEYSNSVCIDKKVNFIDKSCNVDETLSEHHHWTFHDGTTSILKNPSKTYSTPGTYPVTLKVKNGCGDDETTQYINVVDYPDAVVNISVTARDSVVCVGDVITLIDKSNQWSKNNYWTFPNHNTILRDTTDWKLDFKIRKLEKSLPIDTINLLDTIRFTVLMPGTYTFKLTSTNACGTKEWIFPLKVVAAPSITLNPAPSFCETADYVPSLNVVGDVTSYLWDFPGGTPANSNNKIPGIIKYNTPGTYLVTLKVAAECDTITKTTLVVVNSRDLVKIINPNKVFCQGSSPDTLFADRIGGKWSGQGIEDTILGIFNPANLSPGKYEITYTFGPDSCQSIDKIMLEVVASESVVIDDLILCENSLATQVIANPSSGTWSGNLAIDPSGKFDPAISGIGTFSVEYNYIDNNGCLIVQTPNVTVEAFPILTAKDTSIVCIGSGTVNLTEILQVTADSSGGSFQYSISNIVVPTIIDLGNYVASTLRVDITYTRNQCVVKDSGYIQFIEKPIISITKDTILCIDESLFQLMANISGGEWDGPGINSNTGVIDLKLSGSGNKSYTYTFQKNTSCEQIQTVSISIKDPGIGLSAGPNQASCEGGSSFILTGNSPANGRWSGVAIDSTSGVIDASQLKLDSLYSYKYCLTDANVTGCQACESKTFIIHSLPKPDFIIEGLACVDENIKIINKTVGNHTVLFNLGDGTMSTKDTIIHKYTTKGTYNIVQEVTNPFGCTVSKAYPVFVTSKPLAAFTLNEKEGCAPLNIQIQNQSSGDDLLFQWNINNMLYNTNVPPVIQFDKITKDSTFFIELSVSNQCGTVKIVDSVMVHPYPIANFGFSEQSGCSPFVVNFANTSLGSPTSYLWDMGNGNTYTDSIPPSQTYLTSANAISTYSVLYVGSNLCGVDSIRKIITVYPPDVTAFIESPGLSYCQYDSLRLTAFSTPGAINTWKMIAPDGMISGASGDKSIFALKQAGIYTCILYASRCGTDTDTIKVNVLPAPIVDFVLPSYGCAGSNVSFMNISPNTGGAVWDYGDGTFDNKGEHIYTNPGVYKVKLTAFSLINDCPFSIEKQITITGIPHASFTTSSREGCAPLLVDFYNNSTKGIKYDWNFDDMTSNSTSFNTTHVFDKGGIYKVKLTVYDEYGCYSDTTIINVLVHAKPKSNFTYENKIYCHRYDTIQLINQSIGSSGQDWNINGQVYETLNHKWLPLDSGTVSISLVSFSTFGCMDTMMTNIKVLSSPTSLFYVDNDKGCEDLVVNFDNQSIATNQYIWDLSNGTKSVDKNLKYTFVDAGTYNVKLISLSNNGCPNDTLSKKIDVFAKPKADFEIFKDSVCGVPMEILFKNNSIGNTDNNWILNKNEVGQDPDFTIIFTKPGSENMTLIIMNEFFCVDTIQKNFDVYLQPTADFEVGEKACEGEILALKNYSINAQSYIWKIEGQKESMEFEPKLVFNEGGNYMIQLIAIYNEFCKDTLNLVNGIQVYHTPTADFEYQTDYDENTLGEVQFKNNSIDYDRQFWNFGDDTYSNIEHPSHDYNINRNVLVTLITYNDNNGLYTCTDSISKPISPEWITTFYAPNAMSPEYGEGDVRIFKPVGIGLEKYKISIFSPWGEAVWVSEKLENSSPNESWDGMYKGSLVTQGAYSWIADVTFVNGIRKLYKGSVTVLR